MACSSATDVGVEVADRSVTSTDGEVEVGGEVVVMFGDVSGCITSGIESVATVSGGSEGEGPGVSGCIARRVHFNSS